jgi:hypothetical protein
MNDLPADKIGKKQEYQGSQDGVEYYFDIFVQMPIDRPQK